MATRIHNTGITFPDSTTQTTSGGPVVDQYAIGSYVAGRPANTTTYNNSTIAGSSLYAAGGGSFYRTDEGTPTWYMAERGPNPSVSLVNTGSWRCVSIAPSWNDFAGRPTGQTGLWVRYA